MSHDEWELAIVFNVERVERSNKGSVGPSRDTDPNLAAGVFDGRKIMLQAPDEGELVGCVEYPRVAGSTDSRDFCNRSASLQGLGAGQLTCEQSKGCSADFRTTGDASPGRAISADYEIAG